MTVKQLITKLKKCNQDATVCVAVFMDEEVKKVKEYNIDGEICVYVGDDFEELEFQLGLCDEEA